MRHSGPPNLERLLGMRTRIEGCWAAAAGADLGGAEIVLRIKTCIDAALV